MQLSEKSETFIIYEKIRRFSTVSAGKMKIPVGGLCDSKGKYFFLAFNVLFLLGNPNVLSNIATVKVYV